MSSRHRHLRKHNDFYVLSGELRLVLDECGSSVMLRMGEHFSIPPGDWHIFKAITDVELIETYWTDGIDPSDIERDE